MQPRLKMKNSRVFLAKIENSLFFLILLLLPTQIGRHFWPDFAHVFSLRVDYLSPTLYGWDILVVLLLLVWFCQKPRINFLAVNLLLIFLLSQSLSLLGNPNMGAGIVRIEQYLISGLFGVYLASQNFNALKTKLFLPLVLSILGQGLLSLYQFMAAKTLGLWFLGERSFSITTPGIAKFDFRGTEFLRPYGSFPHPNVLATYFLIIPLLLNNLKFKGAKLLILTNLLAGVIVVLTVSRTVILVGLISLLTKLKGRWLGFLIIVFTILLPVFYTRYSALFNFDNLTLIRREELAGFAIKAFLENPLFGIGLNNFILYLATELISGPSRFLQPTHNIYLLALAETGLVGFLGWLVLLGWAIKKTYPLKMFNLIWLIIFFIGFFDHFFITLPQGYRLLFLIWGVSLSASSTIAGTTLKR
jgi:O-antigen ligase